MKISLNQDKKLRWTIGDSVFIKLYKSLLNVLRLSSRLSPNWHNRQIPKACRHSAVSSFYLILPLICTTIKARKFNFHLFSSTRKISIARLLLITLCCPQREDLRANVLCRIDLNFCHWGMKKGIYSYLQRFLREYGEEKWKNWNSVREKRPDFF